MKKDRKKKQNQSKKPKRKTTPKKKQIKIDNFQNKKKPETKCNDLVSYHPPSLSLILLYFITKNLISLE